MRVLALDYGRARTGLALSDETGTLASPLGVVERVRTPAGLDRLLEEIARSDPARIVVGLPVSLRGDHGPQARETLEFVRELEARCTVPIETLDERFTTSMARATLATTGRRASTAEDAVAAAHLLEGYLARSRG
jgi:putative holliday junction resolvase